MTGLPFPAVVGQEDAKLALVLAATEPRLGGVLLRGEKGSAKSTLARGLADLLPGRAPFVDLPLGAGEDRVLGSIDLAALLADGTHRFRPGLLAAADGGVLYVDEINLLADHLVDSLLDVATSGVNVVERDGVSHRHPARFVLVGSMNPEEGELRPQLLDRFGLAVDVVAPADVPERVAAVRRRLDADAAEGADDARWAGETAALRERVAGARPAQLPDQVLEVASGVAVAVGAEGLRADLVLCRAAAALAGWEGRHEATVEDVRRVAPLALAHRRRRTPFEEPGIEPQELDEAFASAEGEPPPPADAAQPPEDGPDARPGADPPPDEAPVSAGAPVLPSASRPPRQAPAGGSTPATSTEGRTVRTAPWQGGEQPVAPVASALALAERRAAEPGAAVRPDDLRAAVRERKTGNLVVLAVDTSGSMGAEHRLGLARGVVLALLADAYQRRDRVALVAIGGERATLALRPTASVEVARARLASLPVGGGTPLADGLRTVACTVADASTDELAPVLVLITDGRATVGAGGDALDEARREAGAIARHGVPAVVVDAEQGIPRLGLAASLAAELGAELVELDGLRAEHLVDAVRRRAAPA